MPKEEFAKGRVAAVTFIGRCSVFGNPIQSISETMDGIRLEKCQEGIRVYKEHCDGYETIYAAAIASVRTKVEAHSEA